MLSKRVSSAPFVAPVAFLVVVGLAGCSAVTTSNSYSYRKVQTENESVGTGSPLWIKNTTLVDEYKSNGEVSSAVHVGFLYCEKVAGSGPTCVPVEVKSVPVNMTYSPVELFRVSSQGQKNGPKPTTNTTPVNAEQSQAASPPPRQDTEVPPDFHSRYPGLCLTEPVLSSKVITISDGLAVEDLVDHLKCWIGNRIETFSPDNVRFEGTLSSVDGGDYPTISIWTDLGMKIKSILSLARIEKLQTSAK